VRAAQGMALRFPSALDLGCGTGLMGEAIRPFVDRLRGVDLSPGMVAKARAKLIYEGLAVGDLLGFLHAEPEAGIDLVLAADVLVYIGDLAPVFGAVAKSLGRNGLFAFTLQSHNAGPAEAGFMLGSDNRFAHSASHVRLAAERCWLAIAHLAPVVTRQDAGRDVPCLVVVLEAR
ncbi:MAG: class I SAM-dependent DNA methyltransferase, partial [Hyphomicrobiales bacterium]